MRQIPHSTKNLNVRVVTTLYWRSLRMAVTSELEDSLTTSSSASTFVKSENENIENSAPSNVSLREPFEIGACLNVRSLSTQN